MTVSIQTALLSTRNRYQSNPSLQHPAQYWSLQHTYTAAYSSLPVVSIHPHPLHYILTQKGIKSIAHRRQNTWHLSQNHESVSFCSAWLWTSEWNGQRLFLMTPSCGEGQSSLQRRLHRSQLITSHTTNQVLFFCTKSGKYYDRIDYIYIHTLHAKYCKHLFLPYIWFSFTFVTRGCTPIILSSSC